MIFARHPRVRYSSAKSIPAAPNSSVVTLLTKNWADPPDSPFFIRLTRATCRWLTVTGSSSPSIFSLRTSSSPPRADISTFAVVACCMARGPAETVPPKALRDALGWLISSTVHWLSRARVESSLVILVMTLAFAAMVSSEASLANTFLDSIAPIESTTRQQ